MNESLKPIRPTTAIRGAFLSVAMRWTDRLLSLLSTVILARLLVPGDFGLVAMAMVAVGFFDVLLDLGVGAALIQHEHAGREEFSTAWTLRLAQCAVTALLLVALAPLVADYYDDPRVVDVLRVAAITVIIGGLENIGTVSPVAGDLESLVRKIIATPGVRLVELRLTDTPSFHLHQLRSAVRERVRPLATPGFWHALKGLVAR